MDHSEARKLIAPFGQICIYHLSGESGWKAVSSDVPQHGITLTRSGVDGRSSYASDSFIAKFCDEAKLIPSPQDGDLLLMSADNLPSFDPDCLGQLECVWSERTRTSALTSIPAPSPPPSPYAMLRGIDLDFTKV